MSWETPDFGRRQLLHLLGVAGLLGLAGCSSLTADRSGKTGLPTATKDIESRVEVPDCPDKPDTLTRESVVPFAVQFEKAYFTRQILEERDAVTYVQFKQIAGVSDDNPDVAVRSAEDGYEVRFSVSVAYGYRPAPRTPESAHADLPGYAATYFLNESLVVRAEARGETPVDPREVGEQVLCPPE